MKFDFKDDDFLIGRFLSVIETAVADSGRAVDFMTVCGLMGADERVVDDCLQRNFGASGVEITKVFSLNLPLFML